MIALLCIIFTTIREALEACTNKKIVPSVSAASSLRPSAPSSSSVDPLKENPPSHPTTDLALALLRAASGPAENFVMAPFSIGAALTMLHDGAREDTQKELTAILGKTLSPAEVSTLYSSLPAALSNKKSAVVMSVANRFFIDKKFPINSEYQSHVEKVFKAGVESLNFKDGDGSANQVNAFVKKNTGSRIPTLVDARAFGGNAVALLINAVYFKGGWETPFETPFVTQKQPFHGIAGYGEVMFMKADDRNTRYALTDDVTVVALEYKDPSYSLVVLMPSGDFGGWRAKLTAETLHGAIKGLRDGKINLKLPKFVTESTTDAKAALQKLGVKRVFQDSANLSGVTDKDYLYVSEIHHKAVFRVSERGTEAVAATACDYIILGCSDSPDVIFDRPFLYAIVKDDEEILFLGQMTHAQEASTVNGNETTGGNTTNAKSQTASRAK